MNTFMNTLESLARLASDIFWLVFLAGGMGLFFGVLFGLAHQLGERMNRQEASRKQVP
jgi:hypothetical protein